LKIKTTSWGAKPYSFASFSSTFPVNFEREKRDFVLQKNKIYKLLHIYIYQIHYLFVK